MEGESLEQSRREADQSALIDTLRDQLEVSEEQAGTMQKTIQRLEDALSQAEAARNEAQSQCAASAELQQLCERERSELQQKVTYLEERLAATQVQLSTLNSKLTQRSSAFLELRKSVDEVNSTYRSSAKLPKP